MTQHSDPRVSGAGISRGWRKGSAGFGARQNGAGPRQSATGARESVCLRHKTPFSYTFCGIPFCRDCRRDDRPEIESLLSITKSEAKRTHDLLTLRGMNRKGSSNV